MNLKKAFTVMLVVLIAVTCVFAQSISEVKHGQYYGKTVVLHSNDVHGELEGYAKMAALRDQYLAMDADVILVDNGDFTQGSPYVSLSKGASAVEMMNLVGYDIVGLGNHEFDYGYDQIRENLKAAKFTVICGDIYDTSGNLVFTPYVMYETEKGARIAFIGIDTPEAQTKVNPSLIKGIKFPVLKEDLYAITQNWVDTVRTKEGADTVILVGHLGIDDESAGYRSTDVMANTTGIDLLIDGHSHSVFTDAEGFEIQQTGIYFANIGVVIIDNATGEIEEHFLVACDTIEPDAAVLARAQEIKKGVDDVYGVKFAESKVDLNGEKAPGNRNMETNNGDLITDSMLWCIVNDPSAVKVPLENVVAITNGGGIRAWLHVGDVSMTDINKILPFGNTVTLVYVTGAELLEALEASTYMAPSAAGGFPQIAGMKITIDTTKAYNPQAETYPDSTYYGPASIERVTINEINGKPFDINATYAVITNNFCAAGGDTYYAFASASEQFDTGLPLDEVLMHYITEVLNGVIGEQYAEPQGRITIVE